MIDHILYDVASRNPDIFALSAKANRKLARLDNWYAVLIAVLLTIAFTIVAALLIWCVVYKHGSFTGSWNFGREGYVNAKCTY